MTQSATTEVGMADTSKGRPEQVQMSQQTYTLISTDLVLLKQDRIVPFEQPYSSQKQTVFRKASDIFQNVFLNQAKLEDETIQKASQSTALLMH